MTKTIIARAHGSTPFEAKCRAAERALNLLIDRTQQLEVKKNDDFRFVKETRRSISPFNVLIDRRSTLSDARRVARNAFDQTLQRVLRGVSAEEKFVLLISEKRTTTKIKLRSFFFTTSDLGANDRGKIVAFGSGSRCSANDGATDDGETLIDCHALALARRALLK